MGMRPEIKNGVFYPNSSISLQYPEEKKKKQINGSRQIVVWSVVVGSTWIRVMDKPCANFNLLISYMQNKVNKQGYCRKALICRACTAHNFS